MATKWQICAKGTIVLLFDEFKSRMVITLASPAVA